VIGYRIVGLKKLQAAVQAAPGLLANRNAEALRSSVNLVEGNAIHLTALGPGHFGFHARDRFRTEVRLFAERSAGFVRTDAPQARWGEFGTKAHSIRPRRVRAIAFSSAGRGVDQGLVVSMIHHPGEKARHTMRKSLGMAKPAIRGFFVGATLAVAESMATKGD
jgi:hypothetical protein